MLIDFTREELDKIYDSAVNELEGNYMGSYEDVDLATAPAEKFDEYTEGIEVNQSIVLKIAERFDREREKEKF